MKIKMFKFVPDKVRLGNRIVGLVKMPPGARVIHSGAAPPHGELCIWAECTSIEVPESEYTEVRIMILKHDDDVAPGWEYRGYILANPILFVYQFVDPTPAAA